MRVRVFDPYAGAGALFSAHADRVAGVTADRHLCRDFTNDLSICRISFRPLDSRSADCAGRYFGAGHGGRISTSNVGAEIHYGNARGADFLAGTGFRLADVVCGRARSTYRTNAGGRRMYIGRHIAGGIEADWPTPGSGSVAI